MSLSALNKSNNHTHRVRPWDLNVGTFGDIHTFGGNTKNYSMCGFCRFQQTEIIRWRTAAPLSGVSFLRTVTIRVNCARSHYMQQN